MTVIYTHLVATGSHVFGNFRKLLLQWTGSIYKLVIPQLCVYMLIYYSINVPYRFLLSNRPQNDTGKLYFHKFVKYSREASSMIPLQFVLGFYVSQIVTRWWNEFMTTPWPDTIAVVVATALKGHDDRGRLMRRTILRYVNTSLNMVFTMISPQARKRFPTLEDLVDAGFLVPHERLIIEHLNEKTPGPKYYVPIVWAGAVAMKARRENRIQDDIALYHLLKVICQFRHMLQDLLSYDWICVPLVYTQVATLATYIYFLACLMGKQFISDDDIDIYVPVFLFAEFMFMMGWLKVAETMINPFGDDDDDFEVNWLVDRNITISYMIVDEMNNEFPEMLKDAFWNDVIPEDLLYTPDSLKYKTEGMGDGSAAIKDASDNKSKHELSQNASRKRFSYFHLPGVGGAPKKHEHEDPEFPIKNKNSVEGSGEKFVQFMEHSHPPEYKDSEVYQNSDSRQSKSSLKKPQNQ